ncbi:MAG: hypothetical protein Q8K29_02435 [Polaromonas sp.]|nr:hypothetical protein [Polaromonas sp.]
MFRRSRAVTFSRYDQRRSRWALPRWLWLLLAGAAAGAGGLLYLQTEVLPPRLTVDASARLNSAYTQAEAERVRLAQGLAQAEGQLAAAVAARSALDKDLASNRAAVQGLQADLAALVETLPPDPRGSPVAVRAMRFEFTAGQLAYGVVLTRERNAGKPMAGVLQLVVTGDASRRGEVAVTLPPVAIAVGRHAVLHGAQPLPEGFRPRQTTVRVLGANGGPLLGMRVALVR